MKHANESLVPSSILQSPEKKEKDCFVKKMIRNPRRERYEIVKIGVNYGGRKGISKKCKKIPGVGETWESQQRSLQFPEVPHDVDIEASRNYANMERQPSYSIPPQTK